MTHHPPEPFLTPQFCFSTVALRDFLRISRGSIDDSITQNLNALHTPASTGFDPSSTSVRFPRPSNPRRISPSSCWTFKNQVLFPSWQMRSDVLAYCASIARSPDPEDPVLRQTEHEGNETSPTYQPPRGVKVVDERLDPYSARFFPEPGRTEKLAAIIRQERGVENIIRARTWGLVTERCGEDFRDWEEALDDWRKEKKEH